MIIIGDWRIYPYQFYFTFFRKSMIVYLFDKDAISLVIKNVSDCFVSSTENKVFYTECTESANTTDTLFFYTHVYKSFIEYDLYFEENIRIIKKKQSCEVASYPI